jgi:hypothetical protein
MFNLEQSIAEWRQQMLAAGIKTPVPLEELESHLREEIEEQIQSGIDMQLAFETAVGRVGHAPELKNEFKKTCGSQPGRSWKLLRMGLIGLAGTPVLNLMGLFVFHRSSSIFFSNEWWSAWFPCYAVWATATIAGVASWIWQRKEIRN